MTEKIGLIKNPLTIIAIFAGIAEVSGTIVLPFISQSNQELFIHFLIFFPSILVILFFITLNFNNKVLYAPSDYKDEMHYITVNKYDVSKQKNIEINIPKEDSKNKLLVELSEEISYLNNRIVKLETPPSEEKFIETSGYNFLVSNFKNAGDFQSIMSKYGVDFEIYLPPGKTEVAYKLSDFRAIWLGKDVKLDVAKLVIKNAKEIFPHLKYIQISGDGAFRSHKQLYVGGATSSAIDMFNRAPLKDSDFKNLETFTDL